METDSQKLMALMREAIRRCDLDRDALDQCGVRFWPIESPLRGHQGIMLSSVGSELVVRLQARRLEGWRGDGSQRALDAACRMYDTGRPDFVEIAGLEELAFNTYARAQQLDEWKRLLWRQSIGPLSCLALRPFMLFTLASRSRRLVKRYRLHRMGLL